LRSELLNKVIPAGFGCGKGIESDGDRVREVLREKVAGCIVGMLPLLNLLLFIISGLVGDLGRGAGRGAIEMGPAPSGSHGLMEASGENGPVQAIGLKLGYVGRKLFDGGRGGHFLIGCSNGFVGS
jgi:hypothetical protein